MKNFILFLLSFHTLIFSGCHAAEIESDTLLLFACNANAGLGERIAENLDIPVGRATVSRFNDGEIKIKINENFRNKDVFVIQSTCTTAEASVNDSKIGRAHV